MTVASRDKNKKGMGERLTFAEHVCLFLDCQTTGASPSTGNLLEMAWRVGNASGSVITPLKSCLVSQPDAAPIPYRIQMLTGITDDEMIGAVSPVVLAKDLKGSLELLSTPKVCIIHYARFEEPFLTSLMREHGRRKTIPFQTLCTFEIARRFYPNLPSRGIKALSGFLGLDIEHAKRAPSHVTATMEIWRHLVERMDESGITTFEQLQEFLAAPAVAKRKKLEYPMEKLKRLDLPDCPGVYRMLNRQGRVLYVGKATSLRNRVNSHFRGRKNKSAKSLELLTQVWELNTTECSSPLEAALLESDEIKRYDPPYNSSLKAGNRKIIFCSRNFDSASERQDCMHYIGPMTSTHSLEMVIRLANTIYSGILDTNVVFGDIDPEPIMDGINIFMERHGLKFGDEIGPRSLVARGLLMFRKLRNETIRLKAEWQAMQARPTPDPGSEEQPLDQIEHSGIATGQSGQLLEDLEGISKNGQVDFEEEEDGFEIDDLSPEDIADRLDSLLIGLARSYLVSKELTQLLNIHIKFQYKGSERELLTENGTLRSNRNLKGCKDIVPALDPPPTASPGRIDPWYGADIADYDRMRVLLTELATMILSGEKVDLQPKLRLLSRF